LTRNAFIGFAMSSAPDRTKIASIGIEKKIKG